MTFTKKKEALPDVPGQLEPIAAEDDSGITLSIETPDDVTPIQEKSAMDVAKGLVHSMTHSSDDQEEIPAKRTRKRKPAASSTASKFFQKKSALIASGLIWFLVTMAPTLDKSFEINGEHHQLAPTDKQADDIVLPLLRILDRHFPVGELNPDVSDLGDCLASSIAYFFELKATMLMLEAIELHEKEEYKRAENKAPFPFRAFE